MQREINPFDSYYLMINNTTEKGGCKAPCKIIQELFTNFFLDLSSLTDSVTQIVELAAANLTAANDLNVNNVRAVERENSLYAYAVRKTANGEGLSYAGTTASDHGALEHLDSFSLTLTDIYAYLYGIADLEFRDVLFLFH